MPHDLPEHSWVDTDDGLSVLCQSLAGASYLILDTEFLRERTYRPELCLIQVKYQDVLACIDAIAVKDLSPFYALMHDRNIEKVFHAASQDLEIFYLESKKVPGPLFDTQVAAPLLGHPEQIGYANLVQERLHIELSKSQTRADWTRRPLSESQVAYALDDVIHLETLYLAMKAELEEAGRLSWLQDDFTAAEDPEKYIQPAKLRWRKVRNIQRYKGPTLSIIQTLATWRELKAREINQPRNWLMKDDVLCTLAQQKPDSVKELSHIRGLDRKTKDRFGDELLEQIAYAKDQPPEPLPAFVKTTKLTPQRAATVQLLNAWVHQRAGALSIAATTLAPQKTLEKMVCGEGREALEGWQDRLIGDDLQALLNGAACVKATNDGIKLITQ
jgi:ribonuclease D